MKLNWKKYRIKKLLLIHVKRGRKYRKNYKLFFSKSKIIINCKITNNNILDNGKSGNNSMNGKDVCGLLECNILLLDFIIY